MRKAIRENRNLEIIGGSFDVGVTEKHGAQDSQIGTPLYAFEENLAAVTLGQPTYS
jgi:hypothetical protein